MIDESGNAAVEALAAGLPALLACRQRGRGADGGLPSGARAARRRRVGLGGGDRASSPPPRRAAASWARLARAYIEAEVPSWEEVVIEDLLPVWQQAASRRLNGYQH